jgi:hypothetical protein
LKFKRGKSAHGRKQGRLWRLKNKNKIVDLCEKTGFRHKLHFQENASLSEIFQSMTRLLQLLAVLFLTSAVFFKEQSFLKQSLSDPNWANVNSSILPQAQGCQLKLKKIP